MTAERLSSFDASFLANEREGAQMSIGAVLLCAGAPPSEADLAAEIEARLRFLPRLRQRLAFPPLGLGRPLWIEDPSFDLRCHLRRATIEAPGDEAALAKFAGQLFSTPLDRSRPLWELWLCDGLGGDRFALIYKTHHALADALAVVDIATLLFSTEPHGAPDPTPLRARPVAAMPSRRRLLALAGNGLASAFLSLLAGLARAARDRRGSARAVTAGLSGLWQVSSNLARPARRLALNGPLGAERGLDWATVELSELEAIRTRLGGTVNDVCLALVAGALRAWLEDRQLDPGAGPLQALVPVSVRRAAEQGTFGNRLTAMRAPLPVHLADPLERLAQVSATMDALKASKQQLGAEALWQINDWFRDFAPPLLMAASARLNFTPRLFNLLVSNFAGPRQPLYVLESELLEAVPVAFLAARQRLAVAILSYNGKVCFGLFSDLASLPEGARIAACISRSLGELTTLAEAATEGP